MGLPVTVYRYTDAGAPQLVNCTPSEWINILKKVLVEGYGSKAPLGWTLEFENTSTFKAAFRSSTTDGGVGGFLQVGSPIGVNTTAADIDFICAASMTAIDTFVRKQYSRRIDLQSSAKGWEIIGTSRGFYLIQHYTIDLKYYSNINAQSCIFVGEYEAYYENDPARFVLSAAFSSTVDSGSPSSTHSLGTGEAAYAQIYGLDGGNTSSMHIARTGTYASALGSVTDIAETLGIKHVLTKKIFVISTSAGNANPTLPQARGCLPGYLTSSFTGYGNELWPLEKIFDGVNHVGVRGSTSLRDWINTEEWYG